MTEKNCFVISPIGEPDSNTRRRAEIIFEFVISKVVQPLGYMPIRSDQIDSSGLISIQIIEHIKNDPLVIADLVEENPNVFYELAIRHVTKKPYIILKEPNQRLPFDVADTRAIVIDIKDIESVENAKESLKGQIEAMGEETPNPISVALDNLVLQGSKNPMNNQLSEIMKTVSEIRETIGGVGKLPIDQENAIRQRMKAEVLNELNKPITSLSSALPIFAPNNKLPAEYQEQLKKIMEGFQFLMRYQRSLIGPIIRPPHNYGGMMRQAESQRRIEEMRKANEAENQKIKEENSA